MKKAVNILLALVLVLFLASAVLFYIFRLELVRIIVENNLLQKAPNDYSKEKIHSAFDSAIKQIRYRPMDKNLLLWKLFETSHSLEKTQHLTSEEVDDLLRSISSN